mgnify:CR=1 FL=1
MIRAEVEKAEQEKAEMEKAQEESASEPQEEEESILSDDIRQLMEALETESADIEAQKIKQDEEQKTNKENGLFQGTVHFLFVFFIINATSYFFLKEMSFRFHHKNFHKLNYKNHLYKLYFQFVLRLQVIM